MKVWNVATKRLENDLPGHADEVYAVDWSPDGSYVGSGMLTPGHVSFVLLTSLN